MTQHCRRQVGRRRDHRAPIPPASGHSAAKSSEDSASCPWIVERSRLNVEGRQHAAPDVSAYGLRIDQVRRRNDHADTDIRRKMHVWHNGYLRDVR